MDKTGLTCFILCSPIGGEGAAETLALSGADVLARLGESLRRRIRDPTHFPLLNRMRRAWDCAPYRC